MRRRNLYRRLKDEIKAISDESVAGYIKRPSFQMSGNKEFFAEGIIAVEVYTEEKIIFDASNLKVYIRGRGLCMCFYNRNTVKISGYIIGIDFE